MHDTIFDGECHSLSEDYGYIAAKVIPEYSFSNELKALQKQTDLQLSKYAEYLVTQDKEKAVELLTELFRSQVMCGCTPEDYVLIHRPSWIVSALSQYETLVLKFKRSKKDNL
jgi:hypothetical protein